jgi:hypothetical protein
MGDGSRRLDLRLQGATAALPGICGRPINTDNVILLRTAHLRVDDARFAASVAVIEHAAHKHYVAAAFRADQGVWVAEHAAQTTDDGGLPRIAPAVFLGPAGTLLVAGWTRNSGTARLVVETETFRRTVPVEGGVVVAWFRLRAGTAVSLRGRLSYLDVADSLIETQPFSASGTTIASTEIVAGHGQWS